MFCYTHTGISQMFAFFFWWLKLTKKNPQPLFSIWENWYYHLWQHFYIWTWKVAMTDRPGCCESGLSSSLHHRFFFLFTTLYFSAGQECCWPIKGRACKASVVVFGTTVSSAVSPTTVQSTQFDDETICTCLELTGSLECGTRSSTLNLPAHPSVDFGSFVISCIRKLEYIGLGVMSECNTHLLFELNH